MTNTANPWITHGSKVIYTNPWIKVREDSVTRPDGLPGIYGVVETRIATGVIALTPDNYIYLVGQYRYPTSCYSWEIIEGGGESDEPPVTTAQRELMEEAGLTANEWTPLGGVIHLSNCHSSEVGYLFLARDLTNVKSSPDGTEVLQIKKIHFTEALKLVHEGEIFDALSIIAILRLQSILKL